MNRTLYSAAAAAALFFGLAVSANAQSFAPQVPNPTNPFPQNPIATDGTPLPSQADYGPINGYRGAGGLYSGRSAAEYGPFGVINNVVGAGIGAGVGAANAGLGVADTAVGTGLGAVGVR